MRLQEFLDKLRDVRRESNDYRACCPSHNDQHSSLSVRQAADGKLLVNCHANHGCTARSICAALGLTERDLFPDEPDASGTNGNGHARPGRPQIETVYDYRDEAGCRLYQCVRFYPKDFRQRRPMRPGEESVAKGGWVWSLKGVPLVLYRLPELLNAPTTDTVFVVEGEKDVDQLRMRGLVATCNPMGAGKWRPCFNEALRGRKVCVIPDNDEPGRQHAGAVAGQLREVAAAVGVLTLPDLPPKGDVSDWLARGGTPEDLVRLAGALLTQKATTEAFPSPIPASQLKRLDSNTLWFLHGYLNRGGVTMLSALWKAGKTTLLSHLLKALGAGGTFCGLPVSPARVLYVSEESEAKWAERRDVLALEDHIEFLIRPFRTRPRLPRWLEFVSYAAELQRQRKYDLVVIDPLSSCWPVKDENDAALVQTALMPLYQLVESAGLLLVHHTRKGDGNEATASRGSGALPAFVDTIVELRRYAPNDRHDRRRVLTGYGRWDETPEELVVELTEAGYQSCGDKAHIAQNELLATITSIMPVTLPGLTADQLLDSWPGDRVPTRQRFIQALHLGVERGSWRLSGDGKRGSPFTYWIDAGPTAGRCTDELL